MQNNAPQIFSDTPHSAALLRTLFDAQGVSALSAGWPTHWFVTHDAAARLPAPLRCSELTDVQSLLRVYRGRVAFTSGPKSPDMVPIDKVNAAALWQMGLTVYFPDVTPYVRGLEALLRQLETELGVRAGSARCGAFASPPGDGLACHYDAEDVISIQLAGRKRFHLAPVAELPTPYGMQYGPGSAPYNDLYPQVAGPFPDWQRAHFESVDMAPGSVLFMPRGTWHRSEALSESLAVSIILRPPTLLDSALEQLRLMLLQDERWRRPLYGLGRNTESDALLRAALAALPQHAAAITGADIVRHNTTEAERIARIDDRSRFQTNPTGRIESMPVPHTAAQMTLLLKTVDDQHGERCTARLEVAPAALRVFEWLAAHNGPFGADELVRQFPAFPLSEHLEILKVAANGQLVKLLSYPQLPRH
jgi:hypothetical protein